MQKGEKYIVSLQMITRQYKCNSNEVKGTPLTYIPFPPPSERVRSCWGLSLRKYWVKKTILRDRLEPECFTCRKQVEGIEWFSFWDSWGACLPSTTTLGPEKRVRRGAWWVNRPVPLNGHKFFMIKNHVVPAPGVAPHTCTQTPTDSPTHTQTALTPCSSPSHWVIFTRALSPLIGADEWLIGSFFTTPST